ncbi:MAG: hypothetical protein ACI4B5_07655 [Bacteroidaceae bacterium]
MKQFPLLGCMVAAMATTSLFAQKATVQLLPDARFEDGFAVVRPLTYTDDPNVDSLYFYTPGDQPKWNLIQWNTRYTFLNPKRKASRQAITYKNKTKRVTLTTDRELTLEIKASKEYLEPRKFGDPWPHLLIEQPFTGAHVHLKNYQSVTMSFDVRLDYCRNGMAKGTYDSGVHAAQTPFFFYVINANPDSEGYRDAVWLGIPSFDNREEGTSEERHYQWDIGTSTYIYTISTREAWGDVDFLDHQWHSTRVDILALLRDAIAKQQENGYFKHTRLEDMIIMSMNFGWEMPGSFDGSVSIRNLNLEGIEK